MTTSKVTYLGDLRTECLHLKSNSHFVTDAPVDNNGKGEAFSPTDTVATALASCMMTVMGIKARDLNVDMTGAVAEVTKIMATQPRRISEIHIQMTLPGEGVCEKDRKILENTGRTCPVWFSLHEDILKKVDFHWS